MGEGASVALTSQASEKIYRSTGADAVLDWVNTPATVVVDLSDGGRIEARATVGKTLDRKASQDAFMAGDLTAIRRPAPLLGCQCAWPVRRS